MEHLGEQLRLRDRRNGTIKMIIRLCMSAIAALCWTTNIASAKDIVAAARDVGQFAIVLKAVEAAGMTKILQGSGPFTVFLPTDAAFQALPPGELERLMKPENKQELAGVLGYHVVIGRLSAADVSKIVGGGAQKATVATVTNKPLTFSTVEKALMVNDARIVETDMKVDNGVVQVIDKVLIPAVALQPVL